MLRIRSFLIILATILAFACVKERPMKPTLYIIGDSTVRNGQGDGRDGLWGWGDFLAEHFDTSRITVVNHAIGGRSSRTFQTEGRWQKILDEMSPGDFVLMQFGHNDGGSLNTGRARGTLKGTGEETEQVVMERDSSLETVHTYGWYMRKYVAETKAAGGIPIVISPIPRNMWTENGKVIRASEDYGKWALEAAQAEGAFFIDLNGIIAAKYDEMGPEKVSSELFLTDHTHTNLAGARINAGAVVEGLRMLGDCPLNKFLADKDIRTTK
jgi:rhamnogalacturonan acetylesterase